MKIGRIVPRKRASLLLVPPVALSSVAVEARQECTVYAQTAIRQVNNGLSWNCGFSGPRWSTDEGLHYCYRIYSYDHNEAANIDSETSLRDSSLADCAAKGLSNLLDGLPFG